MFPRLDHAQFTKHLRALHVLDNRLRAGPRLVVPCRDSQFFSARVLLVVHPEPDRHCARVSAVRCIRRGKAQPDRVRSESVPVFRRPDQFVQAVVLARRRDARVSDTFLVA